MEKIISKVNSVLSKFCIVCKVPCDKQMHFIVGLFIAAILTPFVGAYSVLIVSIIALVKEIYDYIHKDIHTPDFWDWLVTALGGLVGFVVVALF